MSIEKKQTNGCDKLSRVYSEMLNYLQDVMQDDEKLKDLSPLDYSAIGLYIGKFVEQEINSSVVQIMRAFRGVPMPEYFCRRYPRNVQSVINGQQTIYLNSKKDLYDDFSLRTIPLGDAYYALEVLKQEDKYGFFDHYSWLNDQEFLNVWQELYKFRNKMAHIGEIIDADTIKDNYELFLHFLKFMPQISEAKKELMPKGFSQPTTATKKISSGRPYFAGTYYRDKPERLERRIVHLESAVPDSFDEGNKPAEPRCVKAQVDAKKFKLRKGKFGLKDLDGNILVPANYDAFGFLPKLVDDYKRESVIAIRDDRYVLVALDGSGKELTKESYDDIRLADNSKKNSPYIYRKNGRKPWGLMDESGNEMCDNIVDNYVCTENSVMFESDELRGYWHFTKPNTIYLPPIYDDIESAGDDNGTLIFTLNGKQGYVKYDGTFIPLDEFEQLDEDDQLNMKNECVNDVLREF